jgi:hypothetical protein
MDVSKAIDRIPTELWLTILQFATEIEEWNEFARDPVTLVPDFKYKHEFQIDFIPGHLLNKARMTRRRVVLVCKSWYDMCLPMLWSHLVIRGEDFLRKLPLISQRLDSRPELASFILRLDIRYDMYLYHGDSHRIDKLNQFLHFYLFPRLHRLRALCAPPMHATGDYNINTEVVFLESASSYPGYDDWITRPHFWKNTRVLHVELDPHRLSGSPVSVVFPRLIRLRITTDGDSNIIKDIVSLWKTPKLETLSLWCTSSSLSTSFMTLSRGTLTSLHLYGWRSFVGNLVELPKLRTLFLVRCFLTDWHTVIVAPSLEAIHFQDRQADFLCNSDCSTFINLFTPIFSKYPLCKTISQYQFVPKSEPRKVVVTIGQGGKLYFEPPLNPLDDHDL